MVTLDDIIQWNCNGCKTYYGELKIILAEKSPFCICFQESHFKPGEPSNLRGYNSFRKDLEPNLRAHGGVITVVKESIPVNHVVLHTNIQAVAVQVDFPYKMTICNIYLPEYNWTLNDSIELVEQLPTPYLLLGDFNAHNQLWGSIRVDARGRVVEQFINDMGLVIMNNGDGTFFNSRSNNISAIDLTICSAEIAADFLWSSLSYHNGTDHFPVAIECADRLMNQDVPQRWRLEQANWTQYQDTLSTFQLPDGTIDDTVKAFFRCYPPGDRKNSSANRTNS
ncbi:hypothetical protein JTB14_010463 [Gonioctena quinquepunctata]|nr:hypothetical protein JTB14_010463 [Gonioctena quinquepunctata]